MKNLMLKFILLSFMIIIASVGHSNVLTVNLKSQFNNAGDPIPGLDISLQPESNSQTTWR